jgi:signal transduction histidine kinase
MSTTAVRLVPLILLSQALVGVAALIIFVVGAPALLLLDSTETRATLITSSYVALGSGITAFWTNYRRLNKIRYVVRALVLGSRAYEIEEIVELDRIPARIAQHAAGVTLLFAITTLLPWFRPTRLDLITSLSLFLLAALVIAAAALLLYVLVRGAVARVIELIPPDTAREAIRLLEQQGVPSRRVLAHMIAAVVTPMVFVTVGAVLAAQAHVQYTATQARVGTATALARAVGDDYPSFLPRAGQDKAALDARENGYRILLFDEEREYHLEHDLHANMSLYVPISPGNANIKFRAYSDSIFSNLLLFVTALLVVLLLAIWIGWWLGQKLVQDLKLAGRQILNLGNEQVLRRGIMFIDPAQLRPVASLGQAVERLTERFRIFAKAQERRIAAREAALRLRGLLFASVSHDLKSPLNAILGFCTLASSEPMNPQQSESLLIVERRGRELLALLATILDAARVDAQKMTFLSQEVDVADVIEEAVERGGDLGPMNAAPVEVVIDPDLPKVSWDAPRVAQALAALIGHAQRLNPGGGVVVQAMKFSDEQIRVAVLEPSGAMSIAELARLLEPNYIATTQRRLGGLAMGLSLARSLIQLHDGTLELTLREEKGVVFLIALPKVFVPKETESGRLTS